MSHITTVNSYLNYVGNIRRSQMDCTTQHTSVSIVRSLSSFNFQIRSSRTLIAQCGAAQVNVIALQGRLCTYVAYNQIYLIYFRYALISICGASIVGPGISQSELECLVEDRELEGVL